ncbi:MAG: tetratricopeptide repeat protein [Methanobrevibacter sp.]|nr:tetratricopeptide repeat protein [Candidatus Methanovirga meridionalis]
MRKLTKKKLIKRMKKFYKVSNYKKTIKVASEILKLYPDEIDAYITKGDSFARLEKYDEAYQNYKKYLEHSKKDVSDFCIIQQRLMDIDKFEEAYEVGNKGLEIDPDHESLVMNKLFNLTNVGKYEDGFNYVDESSKTSPHWRILLHAKAQLKINHEKHEEALEIYDEILKYDKNDSSANSDKVMLLIALGRKDEERTLVEKMIEENISRDWALVTKGLSYLENKDYKTTMRYMDKTLKEYPDYGYAQYGKGCAFYFMDEKDMAMKYFHKALEKEDMNYYWNTSFRIAIIHAEDGYLNKALDIVDKIPPRDIIYSKAQDFKEQIIELLEKK